MRTAAVWPSPRDFWEAIQTPQLCFTDPVLRTGRPGLRPAGASPGGVGRICFSLLQAKSKRTDLGRRPSAVSAVPWETGMQVQRSLRSHGAGACEVPARFQLVPQVWLSGGQVIPNPGHGLGLRARLSGCIHRRSSATFGPTPSGISSNLAEQWLYLMGALKAQASSPWRSSARKYSL